MIFAAIGKVYSNTPLEHPVWATLIGGEIILAVLNVVVWSAWKYWRVLIATVLSCFVLFHLVNGVHSYCGCTGVFAISGVTMFVVSVTLLCLTHALPVTDCRRRRLGGVKIDVVLCLLFGVGCLIGGRQLDDGSIDRCEIGKYQFLTVVSQRAKAFETQSPVSIVAGNLSCSKCCQEISMLAVTHRMRGVQTTVMVKSPFEWQQSYERLPRFVDVIIVEEFDFDVRECPAPLVCTVYSGEVF
ncbi:MAG: hypothetical protein O3C40_23660 [Planctomycetota bacterium]|nr:hypothetical protein [Planctomycetota bacterium]